MHDPHEIVGEFWGHLWNHWEFALIPRLLSPEIVFRGSLGIEVKGHAGFRGYMETVRAAFPDFHNTIEHVIVEKSRVAARLTYRGTHRGTLLGFPPTGRTIAYSGAAFFTVGEGLITEGWVLGDRYALLAQIGALPGE